MGIGQSIHEISNFTTLHTNISYKKWGLGQNPEVLSRFFIFFEINAMSVIFIHKDNFLGGTRYCTGKKVILFHPYLYGDAYPRYLIGKKNIGKNFRRQKIFVGKKFRHFVKISSLFADVFLPIRCSRRLNQYDDSMCSIYLPN